MLKSTHKPVSALPSLPAGWTEHKAPTGHSYYFNAATNISTYTRPSGVQHISPQPGPTSDFSNIISQGTQLGYQNGALRRPGDPHYHLFAHSHSASGRGDFRGGHSGQRRPPPDDRPKSKHIIPLCSPWFLVKTRLGRRFVYNPEKGESFWKFPPDVMKGVIEYDRLERERKERRERGEENGSDDDGFEAAEELNTAPIGALEGPSLATRETSGVPPQDESDEYEEVEVTDDEDDENPTKRQKTEIEDPEQPVEFNEDDIAYQLAAMGQDYGLDPGEYGDGEDEELEEGAGGLPLTEEDTSALFKDMLDDHHISPYTTWEKIIESNVIVEDDRYTVLPNMKSRKEIWGEWSMDRIQRLREKRERQEKQNPLIPFLAFLQNNATPKLYWPEFRRKFKKESEMRDAKLSDKEREKWYRDYINRLKLPERTLKADLVTLLKSTPLHTLNRSTPPDALPPVILIDLRYISLRSAIRDPMISTYITTLLAAPKTSDVSPEEEENISRRKNERERREDALAERERRVQEEKRRQRGQLQYSKGMLREGEEEVRRAMRVGKEGLKGYLERDELGKGS